MDKIAKVLESLSSKERESIRKIVLKIKSGVFVGFDLKKLKGHNNIFRIRSGKLRVIFKKQDDGKFFVLAIERRTDKTYNHL